MLSSTDPTSRAIFRYQTQSAEFVQAIRTLSAHSGGDCEELAFGGMLRALDKEPRSGSPMYVFTDASAKDASDENIRRVKALADTYGLVINFLLTGKRLALFSCQNFLVSGMFSVLSWLYHSALTP